MKILQLTARRALHIHSNRFSVYDGELRLFCFWLETHVNTTDAEDSDLSSELESYSEKTVIWRAKSTLWDDKMYRLSVIHGCFSFSVEVHGKGRIADIEFFRGCSLGVGSPFQVAGYLLVNSQNRDEERSKYLMDAGPRELTPLRAAPPPFVFPFWNDYNSCWTGIGVTANVGAHNFQKFILNAPSNSWSENGCWFTLPMEGYTEVHGKWTTPAIWGGFGRDAMSVISNYAEWQHLVKGFERSAAAVKAPDWWKKPIFCGWGQQTRLRETVPESKAPDFARQDIYEGFCNRLDRLALPAGSVFIDDKWQKEYGTLEVDTEKWPDMRAFCDLQHEKDRHVVLWLRCWKSEGLPSDECILVDGTPYCADPTNPKYLDRLKRAIRLLLSDGEGCINADGFKLDFMDCFPRMSGAVSYEKGVYGLEMMKRLFGAIYSYAKEVKPDALINMSSAHPYFSSLCDQFRLHDYDANIRSPISTMKFRAAFADAVMPGILVDTDGFFSPTKPEQLRVMLSAAEIGIPDLYFFPEDYTPEDWSKLSEAWKSYCERVL